jgi:4-hydroxyphenylpyruvate dioxygenase
MSDLLLHPEHAREPLQDSFSDESNPVGLDGVEFIEYATARPQALGHVLEMMGFRPVARHRSREVLLYRQGDINIVVNAHPGDANGEDTPAISAVALRVRDARAAYRYVLERGAWEVPTHPEAMELNIPAIHGAGGSRIYFVDRWREFSIYDVHLRRRLRADPFGGRASPRRRRHALLRHRAVHRHRPHLRLAGVLPRAVRHHRDTR